MYSSYLSLPASTPGPAVISPGSWCGRTSRPAWRARRRVSGSSRCPRRPARPRLGAAAPARPAGPGTPGSFSPPAGRSPGKRAQERPQHGRGADPAQQHAHGPVPQQARVLDAVPPRRPCPRPGSRPSGPGSPRSHRRADVLRGQVVQASAGGEGHDRDQPGVRHEVRVIEHGTGPRGGMRQSHLRGVLSGTGRWERRGLPSSQFREHLSYSHAQNHP
jgi:hypothetical protein